MCRYAFHTYKPHFACFQCRKMFRLAAQEDLPLPSRPDNDNFSDYGRRRVWSQQKATRLAKCPQCSQQMHNMGLNFKAPKNNDLKQWHKVELLHRNGGSWHDCGCGGSGPNAKTLQDAERLVAAWQRNRFPGAIQSRSELQRTRRQHKKSRKAALQNTSSTR